MAKYAFVGGILVDGTGAAPVQDSLVLVDDDKITYAGPRTEVPAGYEVEDCTGKTVMPGLIDTHLHFSGNHHDVAAMAAVASPLLETSINGATGVLINVTGAADLGLDDVETAANIVMEAANPEANIIFGATFSEDFEDEMRVTVIATGFDEKKPESKGIYSSSKPAAGSKQQSIPADAASDINDIDEIFKIFNK